MDTLTPMWVYIVICNDGSLYTGVTTNVERRLTQHNTKRGAKYTKPRIPVQLVHLEKYPNHSLAYKREREIKKLTHTQKLTLIEVSKTLQ